MTHFYCKAPLLHWNETLRNHKLSHHYIIFPASRLTAHEDITGDNADGVAHVNQTINSRKCGAAK